MFVLAALALVRALIAGQLLDARLIPDTELYAAGGLGLYPSPLGRVLGLAGTPGLIVASSSAAAIVVVLTALVARSYGRDMFLPALLAFIVPASVWLIFPGVDAAGVCLLLGAVLARRRAPLCALLLVLAPAVHLATAPVALGLAWVLLPWAVAYTYSLTLAILGATLVVATPYALALSLDLRSIGYGVASVALALSIALPLAYRLRRSPLRAHVIASALGAVAAVALVQADDPGTVTRYALPVLALYAAAVSSRSSTSTSPELV